jgi:hypothetical protein
MGRHFSQLVEKVCFWQNTNVVIPTNSTAEAGGAEPESILSYKELRLDSRLRGSDIFAGASKSEGYFNATKNNNNRLLVWFAMSGRFLINPIFLHP